MSSQAGETNSGAAVRGLLLVLVAVVVGVLLLRSVDDPDDAASAVTIPPAAPGDTLPVVTQPPVTLPGDDPVTTVAPTDSTEPTTDTTEVRSFEPKAPSEVGVQVANSTTVRGAASRETDRFKTLNYITLTPTNYAGAPLDRSRVYYQIGWLLEARAIAEVLELDVDNDVFPMPSDTSAVEDFEDPNVLVALGNDVADR